MDQVHQPHPDVMLLFLLLGTDILLTILQWAILGAENFTAGWIIWKGPGLVMMLLMGLTKYSDDLRKHSLLLWAVFLLAGSGAALAETWITGDSQSFCLSMQSSMNLSLIGFAGMAFRQRDEGVRGLRKLLTLGGFTCALSLVTRSYAYITLLFLAHAVIVTGAVCRGWYGVDRKKFLKLLWLIPGMLTLAGAAGIILGIRGKWYREQIIAYGEAADLPGLLLRQFGQRWVAPMLLWAALAGLITLWLVRDMRRITNQFCRITCMAILLGMGVAVLNSCLAILGYGSLAEIYFPFVSVPRFSNCSYIYLYYWGAGIFLHLYRNDRVIPLREGGWKIHA